jgi:hypothetical protein
VKSMLGMFDGEVTDFELPKGYQSEPAPGNDITSPGQQDR